MDRGTCDAPIHREIRNVLCQRTQFERGHISWNVDREPLLIVTTVGGKGDPLTGLTHGVHGVRACVCVCYWHCYVIRSHIPYIHATFDHLKLVGVSYSTVLADLDWNVFRIQWPSTFNFPWTDFWTRGVDFLTSKSRENSPHTSSLTGPLRCWHETREFLTPQFEVCCISNSTPSACISISCVEKKASYVQKRGVTDKIQSKGWKARVSSMHLPSRSI